MPKLIIDNQPIEVPEGTKVIEAAELLGIMIPRFCFHPALGAVGACRVCAVKFIDGPVHGIEMSCMVNSKDGMKVSTTDPEAMDFRMHVIEWLMINHPHDCPVCDEGGHCLLQDMTVSGGHGIRRYQGKKRTHMDQHLGPLVQHEMNRCIACYRCVRYYQEYTGYMDLGVMGIGDRVYFGRYQPGVLKSPFSGNLIDICPTGVFTDKPSRYNGRRWDFERTPGVCIHCSLGCHTTVSARNRQIVRIESRFSHRINGYFICDRGRYGFQYANLENRPRTGNVGGQEAAPESAAGHAITKLDRITERFGGESVAVMGSERSSLETLTVLKYLSRKKEWSGPVFFSRQKTARAVKTAISRLRPEIRVSLRGIEPADVILIAGADPLNEAPMAVMAMRQAHREGAKIFALDPRPLKWPFAAEHLICAPGNLAAMLRSIKAGLTIAGADQDQHKDHASLASSGSGPDGELLEPIIAALGNCRRPVLMGGTEIAGADAVFELAEIAETLHAMNKQAGLFYMFPRANSAGAAMMDESGHAVSDVLEKIESGDVKALVAVESDVWETYPDRDRLSSALERLELLVVCDYLKTGLFEKAHIRISTQTLFEAGGIFINQEGRAQRFAPAFAGGLPIAVTGQGGHPPRTFTHDIPGGDVMPAWKALWNWTGEQVPSTVEAICRWMEMAFPALSGISGLKDDDGVHLSLPPINPAEDNSDQVRIPAEYELLPVASMFGDEAMAGFSPWLKELENPPGLWMSAEDADQMGAADGDQARLELKTSPLDLTVHVSRQMPPGILVLPRHGSIFWQQFEDSDCLKVPREKVRIIKRNR